MITNEMLEKARTAFWAGSLRDALEAIAPALIAQGLLEAAEIFQGERSDDRAIAQIRARARELQEK